MNMQMWEVIARSGWAGGSPNPECSATLIINTQADTIEEVRAIVAALPELIAERDRLRASNAALLAALQGVTRTLEAFSYTTTLGKTQAARLDAARTAIAKAEAA